MELQIDDLIESCARCGGTGDEPRVESPQQQSGYGVRIETYLLNSDCVLCKGTGRDKLTAAGAVLLEFITLLQKKQQI
jgi:hypothetical protein